MKITLLVMGKTENGYIKDGTDLFLTRLKHYCNFDMVEIPALKKVAGLPVAQIRELESAALQKNLTRADFIVLLDEKGESLTSVGFSDFLQKRMNAGLRDLAFVVGGAWGFAPDIYALAHAKISLSKMTFSHQMVRLFFAEQLYRAFTILKGESYHNE